MSNLIICSDLRESESIVIYKMVKDRFDPRDVRVSATGSDSVLFVYANPFGTGKFIALMSENFRHIRVHMSLTGADYIETVMSNIPPKRSVKEISCMHETMKREYP